MPLVTYIEHDGTQHEIDVANGDSVMLGAVHNAIQGIVAECGGGLACGTCVCFVDPSWVDRVGPASAIEKEMLEFSPNGDKPGSRLSCQISMGDELDGLVVHLPESQY